MYTDKTRQLTMKEFDAIRRVESRGYSVDYAAIKQALTDNARKGEPEKSIFHTIYRPLKAVVF